MKIRSNAGKSICPTSYAQSVTNVLEDVSERGACYKTQTN